MGWKVLFVDDEPAALEFFKTVAVPLGYDVATLTDSREAVNLVQDEKFDGVFVDALMPSPDGFELTRIIRNSEANRETKVAMLTGAGNMRQAFQAGVTFFLVKPVTPSLLKATLRSMLGTPDKKQRVAAASKTVAGARATQSEEKPEPASLRMSRDGAKSDALAASTAPTVLTVLVPRPPEEGADSIEAFEELVPPAILSEPAQAKRAETVPAGEYCRSCNATIEQAAKFCDECGAPVAVAHLENAGSAQPVASSEVATSSAQALTGGDAGARELEAKADSAPIKTEQDGDVVALQEGLNPVAGDVAQSTAQAGEPSTQVAIENETSQPCATASPGSPEVHCPSCDAKLAEGAKFCDECGTPIITTSADAAAAGPADNPGTVPGVATRCLARASSAGGETGTTAKPEAGVNREKWAALREALLESFEKSLAMGLAKNDDNAVSPGVLDPSPPVSSRDKDTVTSQLKTSDSHCQNCQTNLEANAKFCDECGSPLPAVSDSGTGDHRLSNENPNSNAKFEEGAKARQECEAAVA